MSHVMASCPDMRTHSELHALIRHHALQEADMREFWGGCGAVQEANLMHFPDTGRDAGL